MRHLAKLCTALYFAQATYASAATQSPARTNADVVTRLSLVKVDDLDFGSLIVGPGGGSVIVSPGNVITITGAITRVGATGGRASFTGLGRRLQLVQVSLPQSSILLTRAGGTETATVDTFRLGLDSTLLQIGSLYAIVSTTGIFNINVGATLRLANNQRPGIYTGTFSLIAVYQ